MICEICRKTTNWDESIGKENYIICNECFRRILSKYEDTSIHPKIFNIIFKLSDVRGETFAEKE